MGRGVARDEPADHLHGSVDAVRSSSMETKGL